MSCCYAFLEAASSLWRRKTLGRLKPVVTQPVNVVEGPGITIREYFGHVASKDGTLSFAIAKVKTADKAGFQAPKFAEYVLCNEGAIEFVLGDLTCIHLKAGEGAFLPAGLRVKWTWPEPTTYTVVCVPAFSPQLSGSEVDDPSCTVVDTESRQKLAELHNAAGPKAFAKEDLAAPALDLKPIIVQPVDVVNAPGITIREHFGHVASRDGTASLAQAVVKSASEEAYQTPLFDEYVICLEGTIKFLFGQGQDVCIAAGQGIFLPKGLRVKWVWLEASKYTVFCLPAFSPALSGREAEEGTTIAKDSASMQRLENLHRKVVS